MDNNILEALKSLEKEHQIKVLYACESGSRAWGFPSPDSDYDVRFIYVPRLDYYVSLRKRPNTLEQMLPGDLDVSGWELAKTLKLYAGTNVPLFEWLQSPVVYHDTPQFTDVLKGEMSRFFNPKKAMFHYLKLAKNCMGGQGCTPELTIKKLLYIARALVCAQWIAEYKTMPATDFHVVLEKGGLIPLQIRTLLKQYIKDKYDQPEGFPITPGQALTQWIEETHRRGLELAESMSAVKPPGPESLEVFLRQWVLQSENQS